MFKQISDIKYVLKLKKQLQDSGKKEIILFGAGSGLDNFYKDLSLFDIKYVVDNDEEKWDTLTKQGLKIKNPNNLLSEDTDRILILIISSFYHEIVSKLSEWGFRENKDFLYALPKLPEPSGLYPNTNILVTCYGEGGGLYCVNLQKDSLSKIIEGDLRGICRNSNGYCILGYSSIYFLDNKFRLYNEQNLLRKDLHGIAYSDGYYYIIETATNTLIVYSEDSLKVEKQINFNNFTEDLHHINDICIWGNRLLISLTSIKGLPKSDRPDSNDGAIVEIDKNSLEPKQILKDNLNFPHSVKVINGDLFYCESLGFNLVKNNEELVCFGGFTRGLEVDNSLLLIGQSSYRNDLSENVKSASLDAGIHIFDPINKITRMIHLPTHNVYGLLKVE